MNFVKRVNNIHKLKLVSGILILLMATQSSFVFAKKQIQYGKDSENASVDEVNDAWKKGNFTFETDKSGNTTARIYSQEEAKKVISNSGMGAGKYDSVGSALLSMMGGIPIGKTVTYGFQYTGIRAFPICASNKSAPEVGDRVIGVCYNVPIGPVKSNPVVGFTTFQAEEGGAQSGTVQFNTETVINRGRGNDAETIKGTLTAQINADVYQGSTGLSGTGGLTGYGGNEWGWSNGIAPNSKTSTSSWKSQDVTAEDACTKYGVACGKSKEEANKEMCSKYNVGCKNDGKSGFSKEAVDRANKTGDICGSLGNEFCGSQSPPKANQIDWKNGKGIGDQINNLLNDKNGSRGSSSSSSRGSSSGGSSSGGSSSGGSSSGKNSSNFNSGNSNSGDSYGGKGSSNSYGVKGSGSIPSSSNGNGSFNSSDNDWMKSSGGGKGVKNLDEFFGGNKNNAFNSPSGDYPRGLTTDSFGLDGAEPDENGNMPPFNSSGIDTYGKAGYNPSDFVDENGNPISDSDFNSTDSFGENNFSNILQDSLHDGLNGGSINGSGLNGNDIFEDSSKSNSLANMIHSLLSGEESGFGANNDKSTLSNQDLFDIAKRLLLEAGFTEDDIKKGLNYDKDSAYTEPNVAWDFNRMTTLLKGRKVKFDNQHEIHQKPKAKPGTGRFGM